MHSGMKRKICGDSYILQVKRECLVHNNIKTLIWLFDLIVIAQYSSSTKINCTDVKFPEWHRVLLIVPQYRHRYALQCWDLPLCCHGTCPARAHQPQPWGRRGRQPFLPETVAGSHLWIFAASVPHVWPPSLGILSPCVIFHGLTISNVWGVFQVIFEYLKYFGHSGTFRTCSVVWLDVESHLSDTGPPVPVIVHGLKKKNSAAPLRQMFISELLFKQHWQETLCKNIPLCGWTVLCVVSWYFSCPFVYSGASTDVLVTF